MNFLLNLNDKTLDKSLDIFIYMKNIKKNYKKIYKKMDLLKDFKMSLLNFALS